MTPDDDDDDNDDDAVERCAGKTPDNDDDNSDDAVAKGAGGGARMTPDCCQTDELLLLSFADVADACIGAGNDNDDDIAAMNGAGMTSD